MSSMTVGSVQRLSQHKLQSKTAMLYGPPLRHALSSWRILQHVVASPSGKALRNLSTYFVFRKELRPTRKDTLPTHVVACVSMVEPHRHATLVIPAYRRSTYYRSEDSRAATRIILTSISWANNGEPPKVIKTWQQDLAIDLTNYHYAVTLVSASGEQIYRTHQSTTDTSRYGRSTQISSLC